MKKVNTDNAPKAIGPYSQAVVVNGIVYTSGQIALNPVSNQVEAEGIFAQTKQVCENLKAVLEACGAGLDSAIKTTCFLHDMRDFASFNEVYGEYFSSKPARSCVEVSCLPKNVLVEVEVIAKVKD